MRCAAQSGLSRSPLSHSLTVGRREGMRCNTQSLLTHALIYQQTMQVTLFKPRGPQKIVLVKQRLNEVTLDPFGFWLKGSNSLSELTGVLN